jgi:hypothetical protein
MVKPEKYSVQNLCGSVNIVDAAVEAGVGKLVFSSSAAVYGEPKYLPMDENHPTSPENYYGFTKLEIERILAWYDKLKGLRYAALRYFNAAGYDPARQDIRPREESGQPHPRDHGSRRRHAAVDENFRLRLSDRRRHGRPGLRARERPRPRPRRGSRLDSAQRQVPRRQSRIREGHCPSSSFSRKRAASRAGKYRRRWSGGGPAIPQASTPRRPWPRSSSAGRRATRTSERSSARPGQPTRNVRERRRKGSRR